MSTSTITAVLLALTSLTAAQQIGTSTAEVHPTLTWQKCTGTGSCTTQQGSVTLDANWRWVHSTTGYTNCYTGNTWDTTLCPDPTTCAANCALDGASYSTTYGVTTSGNALTLDFVSASSGNVGSRLYMMASNTAYEMFKPLNQEFTFDVDVSTLPCGLNGAVYFSEMAADGGMSAHPTNKAGAQYGTGYCDSQCPKDLKFINGAANTLNWTGTSTNSGTGEYGSCCNEMDIWEANSISAAYTPHPCSGTGLVECSGATCTSTCDQAGCDFNSYRMGNLTYYGPSKTIDTTKVFTIVTQFLTSDGTATGTLSEIKRFYVQNGQIFQNSVTEIPGMAQFDSITPAFCDAQKTAFGDTNTFDTYGGLATMGKSLGRGVVLVLSIWDDYAVDMLWLDSEYPTTANPSSPGVARGTCSTSSGQPATVESQSASAKVIYSNIKFGDIGSTYTGTPAAPNGPWTSGSPSPTTSTKPGSSTTTTKPVTTTTKPVTTTTKPVTTTTTTHTTTTTAPPATQTHYGQCGGTGWTGPTACASPYKCTYSSAYYSQCL